MRLQENISVKGGKIMYKRLKRNKYAYIMMIPVLLYYIIFCYVPIWGLIVAFQDYSPIKGVMGSEWVGFKHFISFFNGMYFYRLVRNAH